MNIDNAVKDDFVMENMPAEGAWPEFINVDGVINKSRFNCVSELLDGAVDEGHGDKIAIHSSNQSWTYAQLLCNVNQIANVLIDDYGLIPGGRVLLRSANNPMLAACWLAVVKAGGVVVTTIAMLRAKEIEAIVESCSPVLALCDERLKEDMAAVVDKVEGLSAVYFNADGGATSLESLMSKKQTTFDSFKTDGSDIALIGFTSGTTGRPKGALHSHLAVMAVCESFSKGVVGTNTEDVFSGTPPLGFVYGLGGLLLFPLHARATTVLLEDVRTDALINAIDHFNISVLYTAPTAYKALLDNFDAEKLSSIKKGISAGEALPTYVSEGWLEKKNIRLIDGIGSTELLHIFISVQNSEYPMGTLGKAVPGYEARIIDESGIELGVDKVGLIAVKGPTGCRYLNDARQKEYVMGGWNVTGDTAKVDENGYFWYQARTDGMIISSGYNIAAPDVEQTVSLHPAVAECAVIGVPDESRGNIVRAYVVLTKGVPRNDELIKDIQDFAKKKASPYKYPRSIKFIDVLPRTQTGKIQHFVLREAAKNEAKST